MGPNLVREADAQRGPAGRSRQKHAAAPSRARAHSGSARRQIRHEPDLSQLSGALRTQRVDRQHRPHRGGATCGAVDAPSRRPNFGRTTQVRAQSGIERKRSLIHLGKTNIRSYRQPRPADIPNLPGDVEAIVPPLSQRRSTVGLEYSQREAGNRSPLTQHFHAVAINWQSVAFILTYRKETLKLSYAAPNSAYRANRNSPWGS